MTESKLYEFETAYLQSLIGAGPDREKACKEALRIAREESLDKTARIGFEECMTVEQATKSLMRRLVPLSLANHGLGVKS